MAGLWSAYGRTQLLTTGGGPPATLYAQAHSGDPGTNGTANVLAGVARIAVPLAAPSNGLRQPSAGTYQFDILAGQHVAYVSYWDAATNGNFWCSSDVQPEDFTGAGKYTLTSENFTVT